MKADPIDPAWISPASARTSLAKVARNGSRGKAASCAIATGRSGLVLGDAGNFAPGDELNVLLRKQIAEFLAGEEIEITLAPGSAPGVALARGGFQFIVVVAEVDDEFGYAGLQILEGGLVKIRPLGGRNGGCDGDGVVED